jgi:hypothetical protein
MRRRIDAESNEERLERWLSSAVTASAPSDIFTDA